MNTNSFSVDQGRYAVAQVNYFTKSGTNAFHGDVYEIWNGSLFNAENYFLHANDSPGDIAKKPRSTINEFGVSVGGPIRKNKLFFFGHFEGIRIALPLVSQITLPSTAYQQYVLGQLATGGIDPVTGTNLPAQPAEIPFYRNMFSLLPTASGSPISVNACPLDGNGNLLPAPPSGTVSNGAGCAVQRQQSLTNSDSENLIVVKIDHTSSQRQRVVSLSAGHWPSGGLYRPDQSDLQCLLASAAAHLCGRLHPCLQSNARQSVQPRRELVRQHLQAEQLLAGATDFSHRACIGQRQRSFHHHRRQQQYLSPRPQSDAVADQRQPHLDSRETHAQIRHQHAAFGCGNYDLGEGTVPTVTVNDLAQFTYGAAYTASQSFPVSLKERVSSGNFEYYAMDTYKPTPKATFTLGMRVTWNTNVTSKKDLFARTAGSFLDATHDTNQAMNQTLLGNVHTLFPGTPLFVYQPRVSFAYQLAPRLAVHGGFGAFNDIIPMQIADLASMNAPNDPTFVGGIAGQVGGIGLAPGVPGSALDAAVNANQAFQTLFRSGGAPCAGIQPGAPTCPLAVSLNTFPTGTLKTPYYYQYDAGIEQQIGKRGNLRADFVGTRGLHEPYQVRLNGYQTVWRDASLPFHISVRSISGSAM